MELDIRKFLRETFQITDEEILRQAEDVGRLEHLKKGALVIETGERHQTIAFLIQGVARGFLIDESGHDISDCFAFRPGEALMGCGELQAPSAINIEAVTACEVLQFPVSMVLTLMEGHPQILEVYNRFLRIGLERHWAAKMCMCQYPAMQRYQWFLQAYPGLDGIVSSKNIASFLGITPVTLSRLRRDLREAGTPREFSGLGKSAGLPAVDAAHHQAQGAADQTH